LVKKIKNLLPASKYFVREKVVGNSSCKIVGLDDIEFSSSDESFATDEGNDEEEEKE